MMDLQTIQDMSRDAAKRAARDHKHPFIVEANDVGNAQALRGLPYLGTYCPEGWARVNVVATFGAGHGIYAGDNSGAGAYMVDSCGWGKSGEPALTIDEFAAQVRAGYGYGICEAGQFQVKIGVYQKCEAKAEGKAEAEAYRLYSLAKRKGLLGVLPPSSLR